MNKRQIIAAVIKDLERVASGDKPKLKDTGISLSMIEKEIYKIDFKDYRFSKVKIVKNGVLMGFVDNESKFWRYTLDYRCIVKGYSLIKEKDIYLCCSAYFTVKPNGSIGLSIGDIPTATNGFDTFVEASREQNYLINRIKQDGFVKFKI